MNKIIVVIVLTFFSISCVQEKKSHLSTKELHLPVSKKIVPDASGVLWVYYWPKINSTGIDIIWQLDPKQLEFFIRQVANVDNDFQVKKIADSLFHNHNHNHNQTSKKYLIITNYIALGLNKNIKIKFEKLLRQSYNFSPINILVIDNDNKNILSLNMLPKAKLNDLNDKYRESYVKFVSKKTILPFNPKNINANAIKSTKTQFQLGDVVVPITHKLAIGGVTEVCGNGMGLVAVLMPYSLFQNDTEIELSFYKKNIDKNFPDFLVQQRLGYCYIPGAKKEFEFINSSFLKKENKDLIFARKK